MAVPLFPDALKAAIKCSDSDEAISKLNSAFSDPQVGDSQLRSALGYAYTTLNGWRLSVMLAMSREMERLIKENLKLTQYGVSIDETNYQFVSLPAETDPDVFREQIRAFVLQKISLEQRYHELNERVQANT